MEVHQHTHTPRKKWTHYCWEFLMLFLAVFCGFLAENQREHFVEKKREKQYIKSMIADLKEDTSIYNYNISVSTAKVKGLDSMIKTLNTLPLDVNYLYYARRRHIGGFPSINLSQRTLNQLKNSGALRLIRNPAASDSINKYDISLSRVYNQEDLIDAIYKLLIQFHWEIFDLYTVQVLLDSSGRISNNDKMKLITKDVNHLTKYSNAIISWRN